MDGSAPPVETVRDGLWSIPVPIPDNPLRYTLTYVFEAGAGQLVVVDPGWETAEGWDALVDGLASVGASPAGVTGVVVTHAHADHLGLAGRLRQESGAWIAMHPAEATTLPSRVWDQETGEANDAAWLATCGVPRAEIAALLLNPRRMRQFLTLASPDILLEDGDLVPVPGRRVRAVWTPGHTPGHLCFHDEDNDLLLTGDHVLPRISPNIAVEHYDVDPPLASYLASLERVAQFDSAEALPAHEYRFRGLKARSRVLITHHERRCEEVAAILNSNGESTVWDVARQLRWSRGWTAVTGLMRRAAVAEARAHLQYMADRGTIAQLGRDPLTYAGDLFISTSNSSSAKPSDPAS